MVRGGVSVLAILLVLAAIGFGALFAGFGYQATWHLFGVEAADAPFMDLRGILAAGVSLAQGFDPLVANPGDPWARPMNNPRLWLLLPMSGLDADDVYALGFLSLYLFLAALVLACRTIRPPTAWRMMPYIVSPAVLLAMERANNDLILFAMVAVAAVVAGRRTTWAAGLIFSAFLLKLYPIVAAIGLQGANRRGFYRAMALMIVAGVLYVALTYDDILLMAQGTRQGWYLSYGAGTAAVVAKDLGWLSEADLSAWRLGLQGFGLVSGLGLMALGRSRVGGAVAVPTGQARLFVVGAAIFLGTFVAGNNYDYRMIFLLLTLPALVEGRWAGARGVAIAASVSILVALWSQWVFARLGDVGDGVLLAHAIDDLASWGTFWGLAYLSGAAYRTLEADDCRLNATNDGA